MDGELLTDIYLEMRRGLELEKQGGARARVQQVDVTDLVVQTRADGALEAVATWVVTASVGHWGHVHQRKNQYHANLELLPIAGAWKLVALEVLTQERL